MATQVEAFYDDFSRRFVEDIVQGNERIAQQLNFFAKAIPSDAQRILVIGSGSGQGAYFIATRVVRSATILAVDISSENLGIARTIFPHPRIEYRKADITTCALAGDWDVIVLPDVYEHIPIEARPTLHSTFNRLLTSRGKILFTVPSPGKQLSLKESGQGLQVIDEIVSLEDLNKVATDVDGTLTYFSTISVWETNDYIHAVVERGAEYVKPIGESDLLPIKGWPRQSFLARGWNMIGNRFLLFQVLQSWRRKRLRKQLTGDSIRTA